MKNLAFLVLSALFALGLGAARRPNTFVGGYKDRDVSEAPLDILNFAVAQYNQQTNDMYRRQVMNVTRFQSQVVSGINYRFTVQMARTNCTKSSEMEVCTIPENSALTWDCTFTVWSQPWLSEIRLTSHTC